MNEAIQKKLAIAAAILIVVAGITFWAAAAAPDRALLLNRISGLFGVVAGALLVYRAMARDSLKRKRFLQVAIILNPGCALILVSLGLLVSEDRALAGLLLKSVLYVAYATIASVILHVLASWKRRRV